MAFPTASGHVQYSGNFIPEIWSGLLVPQFYDATVLAAISNTDYEGEIKSYGDKVNIRETSPIVIRDYVKGKDLVYEQPEGKVHELLIDQGKYFAYACNSVDKHQSDIAILTEWARDASEQMKITIDTDVLAAMPLGVDAMNMGDKAGRKSGDINLGKTGAPVSINGKSVIDSLVDLGVVLDEQNIPEQGRWVVVPAWFSGKIKRSELKDASITGDGKSMLRNGRVGMVDRFEVYVSNLLPSVTDGSDKCFSVLAGHKKGLTFATQITELEEIANPKDFGALIRGLQVYGFKVVKGQALARLYCKKAAEA